MKQILSFVLILVAYGSGHGQTVQVFNTNGVAIRGYDAVAYFVDKAAVQGSKDFSFNWQEVEWHFKDQKNLEAFKSNPEKYAPQFGGYCAYGVSENHKSPTDPKAFTIVDDKLYLNYNAKVKELWVVDIPGKISLGEKNWVELKDKKE